MKILIKNSEVKFMSKQIDPLIIAELKSAYGNNISQKKIEACADFLSAIGYGRSGSIYSKMGLLVIPILADLHNDVVNTTAFYDFISKNYARIGGEGVVNGVLKTMYLTEDGEYKYSDHYNFTTRGVACKADETNAGYPFNLFNYSKNSITLKTFSPFYVANSEDGYNSTTLFTGGGTNTLIRETYKGNNHPYISLNLSSAFDSEKTDHIFVMSGLGTTGEVIILDGTELTYSGETTIDESIKINSCGFGASASNNKYINGCRGDLKYKMIGFANGLTVTEARTLHNAMKVFINAM